MIFFLVRTVQIIDIANIDRIKMNRFLFISFIMYECLYIIIFAVINDTTDTNDINFQSNIISNEYCAEFNSKNLNLIIIESIFRLKNLIIDEVNLIIKKKNIDCIG